jgi:hypothetical protein
VAALAKNLRYLLTFDLHHVAGNALPSTASLNPRVGEPKGAIIYRVSRSDTFSSS